MEQLIDAVRRPIRRGIREIARALHAWTRGKLTPNMVTWAGFVAHVPIAALIAFSHNLWAALLLVVFGLFDTLDGELAGVQKRGSQRGALLDAATDRMKEILLYCGAAYALIGSQHPYFAVWAVVACGASLTVSYVKAKGEAAVANIGMKQHELNHIFHDGLMRFEVRMTLLVLGLVANQLGAVIIAIAVLSSFTAFQRLSLISKKI